MKIMHRILRRLGLNTYSDFTKAAFIQHNIKALRFTCIIAGTSALLFFLLSITGHSSLPVSVVSFLTMLFTALLYVLLKRHPGNTSSFHQFHSMILIAAMWLSFFGIVISLYDCANGGGLMVFLITQLWVFDMLLIPPFVSIVLAGIDFTVFLILVFLLFHYPPISYFEIVFFYITMIVINYFHYNNALQQTYEEENVIHDNEHLAIISITDSLTDARNRAALQADASHYKSENLYVIMMDIDNFKKYNDTYGHQAGDRILKCYASAMLHVFGSESVYRYGGDEFLIIKVMNSPEEFFDALFQVKWIASHTNIGIPETTTCSCGCVYGSCTSDNDLRMMITQADQFLYKAKNKGKNQVESGIFQKP